MKKVDMHLKELEISDFWNGNEYYLTDGVTKMSLEEFLEFKNQGSRVLVETDNQNIFDLAFWIMEESGNISHFLGGFSIE